MNVPGNLSMIQDDGEQLRKYRLRDSGDGGTHRSSFTQPIHVHLKIKANFRSFKLAGESIFSIDFV